MKNLFLKTLAIGLFLLAMPTMQYGQQVQIKDYENGFLFNVFQIANVEERVQLASALATSDVWLCNPTDNPGELFIRPNSYHEDISIYAEFDYLRMILKEEYKEASALPKEEFGEIYNSWASNLTNEYYNFLISDYIGDRANQCMDAEPFCTSDVYNFPAINSGVSWYGPNYGCLGSSPTTKQSFWYYMKIGVAGNITIKIQADFDVDFALWGPFNNETDPCPTAAGQAGMLTATCSSCPNNTSSTSNYPYGNLHDCSYDSQHYEYAHVVNGQVGQYFILLITNFSGSSGNITFQKYAGNGETDCSILPPLVNNDGPFCVGDAIHLTANGQAGAAYHWTGPNNYSSNQQNPTISNCNLSHNGTYTCTITVGNQSNNASTNIEVYARPTANFTANSVCLGNDTQFSNSSTTNPANQTMSYLWDFGDGQTSTQPNPTHQFATAGSHSVTLTTSCGSCTSTKTQSVMVYETPVANAGEDQTIQYGGTAQLHGSGGLGSYLYHWEPANKVVNANAQNTQTLGLTESTTFTLTVTQSQGGCSSTDQVSILVNGSNMTATASATPSSICSGSSSQLSVRAIGGNAGNYTYSWSPSLGLSNPIIANPVASPTTTTTYTCSISDGYTTQQVSTTVTVNQPEYIETTEYICPGESYTFYGTSYSEPGDYHYNTTTAQGCEKVITLHLRHYPSYQNAHTTTEAICSGNSYNFHGQYFNTEGMHSVNLHTIHGCDSIVWLDLTVYPENPVIVDNRSICSSQSLTWYDGNVYNQDGDEAFYDSIDNHGCLQVYQLHLSVGDYQTPPNYDPRKYVCVPYDEQPFYHWDIANRDYTQNAQDTIIVSNPDPNGCDFEYTLDLKFHQNFHEVQTVVACDEFIWDIDHNTYSQSGNYEYPIHYVTGGFDCPGEYVLNLTINDSNEQHDEATACNEYTWIYGIDQQTITYNVGGHYEQFTETAQGCELLSTLDLNLDYTPSFSKVWGKPWVVGGSEFQYTIENYWLTLDHPRSMHETTWELFDSEGKPFNKWDVLPYDNGDKCYLYIYTFETDSVRLHVHTYSTNETCNCGEDEKDLWIHCGYHSVNETIDPSSVDIFPNPNSGNMTLSFDNMMGEVEVKVYNITGTLVDEFSIYNGYGHQTHTYHPDKLSDGVYFFQLTGKDGMLTKKVIIID